MRVRPAEWMKSRSRALRGDRLAAVAVALMIAIAPPAVYANGLIGARALAVAVAVAVPTDGQPTPLPKSGLVDAPLAHVSAAHLDDAAESARLTFDLAPGAPAFTPSAYVLAGPDRVIIDLPQVDFPINADIGKAQQNRHGRKVGLVSSYRFGLFAPRRSRVVVDLAGPVLIVSAAVKTVGATSKLVVEFAKTDAASFLVAARSRTIDVVTAPESPRVIPATGKTTIVIDPGHGGPDNGAIVNGVVEKEVTLAFAKMLASKLEATGTFNVVMTRASDIFIPLSERVHVARGAEAALMISVHADTLPESADVNGTTVYTVSDRASDAYAAKVAAKENEADASVGVDGQADKADVNDILFDLTRQETRAYSHVFARTLVNYWKVVSRLNKNPQRAAGFVVLKAPDVPSVLVELGYLSSPLDSAALTSEEWREKATARMAEAVIAYFADRHGPAKAVAGVPMPLQQADLAPGLRK